MSDPKNNSAGENAKIRLFKIPNLLKKKLGMRTHYDESQPGYIADEAIAEADGMIAKLCEECPAEISENMGLLIAYWKDMRDMAQSPERDEIAQKLFTTAHEIKDLASMCGHDLTSYFAESLRDFVGRTELNLKAQRVIIQAHVDALQLVVKQGLKDGESAEASELKKMVKIAIDKYS